MADRRGSALVSESGPPSAADRLLLGLLMALIVGVPTVFLRTTFSTFDIPQLVTLWVLAVGVVLIGLYRVIISGVIERGPTLLTVTSAGFLGALVLTSVLSSQPWVAFTGLTVRGAGAVTYGLCLALLHAAYRLGRRQSLEPIVLAFCGAHGIVAAYALLQAYESDPFTWGAGILYVGPVFSTLGNPNFSSGYLGLTLPLLVWLAFGSKNHLGIRVGAGAGIGASLVALNYLNSFQGDVSALAAIAVLGHWVWLRDRSNRLAAAAIVLPVVTAVSLVPLTMDSPPFGLLVGLVAITATTSGLGSWWDRRNLGSGEADRQVPRLVRAIASLTRRKPWTRPATVFLLLAAGAAVFGRRILEQLESGLEQRVAFWKTSLSIFISNPITGTGLETYRSHFTSHRPLDHAIQHEFVLSDSPHSVPLGLLSGGGLLLAITYAALMVVVFWVGVRAVRQAVGSERLFYGAVLAGWIGYHVQSSVSMDMPGLIHTQWLLGGILLAGGAPGRSPRRVFPWAQTAVPRPRSVHRAQLHWWGPLVVTAPLLLLLSLLLAPLTAPLRADLAAYKAQQALDQLDFQTAGDELLRAIELQPRNFMYADGMALVYQESGLYDLALSEMDRSAQLQPGNGYQALAVAEAAVSLGRPTEAANWSEHALVYAPNGASVLARSAAVLSKAGRVDRAKILLAEFELLQSTNLGAWLKASEAYRALGRHQKALRTDVCSEYLQVGCWD